ncbi:ClpP/crotonase [Thozetella sp. PMI_491]|nr:ClpP/crotonase [Thozetella sp. PMI_491]
MHFYKSGYIVTAALVAAVLSTAQTSLAGFINTTKVTPSYWRATFNSPPLNVEGTAFFEDFYALIDLIANDSDVNVVVFDSAVPDFWLAHFDLINPVPNELLREAYWGNITRLANLPVLTVAALRGIARGGGAEIALALDVRFGSKEKAVLAQFEVSAGAIPGGGSLDLLPRLVGRSRALEIVIGSDDFDAETAAQYGWINRAIPDRQFEEFVDRFARRVAAWQKEDIATAKSIINEQSGFPSVADVLASFNAFEAKLSEPLEQERLTALLKAGLQSNVTFEKNLAQEVLKFVGSGPFN